MSAFYDIFKIDIATKTRDAFYTKSYSSPSQAFNGVYAYGNWVFTTYFVDGTYYLLKLDATDLSLLVEVPIPGNQPWSGHYCDGTYLYISGNGGKIYRLNVTDLTEVNHWTPTSGEAAGPLTGDGSYIYALVGKVADFTGHVFKFGTSLTLLNQWDDDHYPRWIKYDPDTLSVFVTDNYSEMNLYRIRVSDMTLQDSTSYGSGGLPTYLAVDSTYLYGSLDPAQKKFDRFDKSPLAFIDETIFDQDIQGIEADGSKVFVGQENVGILFFKKAGFVPDGSFPVTNVIADGLFCLGDKLFASVYYDEPMVDTREATQSGTDETINGYIESDGGFETLANLEYGLTPSYGNETTPEIHATGESFQATLSGLETDTIYHYRAKIVNVLGTFYGTDETFVVRGPCTGMSTVGTWSPSPE